MGCLSGFPFLLIILLICVHLRNNVIAHGSVLNSLDDMSVELLGKSQGLSSSSAITEEILQSIMKGVRSENKNSIYFYGLLKLYGISVPKDRVIAASSFKRAAELGHVEASTAYGVCLMTGNGIERNIPEALIWLRKGVDSGDGNAKWLYGKIMLESQGHNTDQTLKNEVFTLINEAAAENIPQAQHFLGLIYEYGVPPIQQDLSKATEYYKRAADQKFVESIYNLALMHAYGRGFPQDFLRAKALFETASRLNHAPSIYYMGLFKYHGYGEEYVVDEVNKEANYDSYDPSEYQQYDLGRKNADKNYVRGGIEYHRKDYYQALHWFERAAGMDDLRVRDKAINIANELRSLLDQATIVNAASIEALQKRSQTVD